MDGDTSASGRAASPSDEDMSSTTERLFAEFLARDHLGTGEGFTAFRQRHPGHERDLDRLYSAFREIGHHLQEPLAPRAAASAGSAAPAPPDPAAGERLDPQLRAALHRRIVELSRLNRDDGRYGEKEFIDQGGMGVIWRTWNRVLQRFVAKKVIRTSENQVAPRAGSGAIAPEAVTVQMARFERETRILAMLDHPGIVPIFDFGVDEEGHLFFTMPIVQGHTLHDILLGAVGGEAWSQTRLVGLLLQATEAIGYAHSRGVVHRDLKPANIMVGQFGEVLVMDWGLARPLAARADGGAAAAFDDGLTNASSASGPTPGSGPEGPAADLAGVTARGRAVGTPAYMSLEQALARTGSLEPAVDIYALGAILYHVLVGHAPYMPEKQPVPGHVVAERLLAGAPPAAHLLRDGLPPELVAIAEKAMQRDPRARYGTATEMAADLRALLEGRVVQAHRTGPWTELRKWVSRNRRLAAALTGIVVLGLAALSAIAWQQSESALRAAADKAEIQASRLDRLRNSARSAARRGAWRQALAESEQALGIPGTDDVPLRLDRARYFVNLAEPGLAHAELQALAGRSAPPGREGEALLVRGMIDVTGGRSQADVLGDLQAAIDAGLLPADEDYATGLLAPTSRVARICFEGALRKDPFHYQAWEALLTTLMLSMNFGELHTAAGKARAAFPDSPLPDLAEGVAAAIRRDDRGIQTALDRVRPIMGAAALAEYATALDVIRTGMLALAWRDLYDAQQAGVLDRAVSLLTGFMPAILRLQSSSDQPFLKQGLVHQPFLADSYGRMPEWFLNLGNSKRAAAIMSDIVAANPCDFFEFWAGLTQRMAGDHVQAEAFLVKALDEEPLSAEFDIARHVLLLETRLELFTQRRISNGSVKDAMFGLLYCDGLPVAVVSRYADIASRGGAHSEARQFVARWRSLEPEAIEPLLEAARIERRAGATQAALGLVEEALRRDSGSGEAARLLADLQADVRQLAGQLEGSPDQP